MLEQLRILFLEHPNPVIYAIPFIAFFILIEFYLNYRDRRNLYLAKDSIASSLMGIGSLIVDIFTKSFYFLIMIKIYQFGLFKDELLFTWWAWILLFFLDDLSFYWHHRCSHIIRILWASHVVHHSSQKYNLSTAFRQSWTEVTYKYIFYLWLPFIGFHPLMVMTMIAISLIYQFSIHTQIIHQLPKPIEFIFNTPSHHRVHHASNIQYLDRNFGGILIIWDRIFGSFEPENPKIPVNYGITKNIKTFNPLYIASHEFLAIFKQLKQVPNWSTKIKYLLKPPGWSHISKSQTTKDVQQELNKNRDN